MGDLFRVETLTQHVEVFKTYRPTEGGSDDDLQWRRMRRGVADMHRRVRVLHCFEAEDHRLLQAVHHGEFTINGFRNRDLPLLPYGPGHSKTPLSPAEKRRRSAAVSRKLRILRAHRLIQKVPKTHRYHVTSHGRLAITAILTMDRTSIALLNKAAA